jgi:hypothetical protein
MQIMKSMTIAALIAFACLPVSSAQSTDKYTIRLAPGPRDPQSRNAVVGKGSATATVSGMKLTIEGAFEGLPSAAISASLRRGIARGARGPVIQELSVSKSTTGMISGSITLNAEQIQGLTKGQFYIQIDSEKASNGNLWGWLLP